MTAPGTKTRADGASDVSFRVGAECEWWQVKDAPPSQLQANAVNVYVYVKEEEGVQVQEVHFSTFMN